MSAQPPVPAIWNWFLSSPYDENLLNICPELAMRNLYHHDRWGSANSFGDFLLVSNLDLGWSQWISESSAQENMKSFHGISSRGMNCMTKSHSFHRHVCLLACILCALCINKNGFVLQSLWWALCWIFLLITPCGIFTTMIVEGLRMNLEMFWLFFECSVPEMARKGFWVWQDAKDASQSRVLQCHRFSCFCVCDLSLSMSLRLEHLEHFAIVAGKVRGK